MANKSRKFLALVLTLVLAFSLMSVAVAAAGETVTYTEKVEKPSTSNVLSVSASNFVVVIKQGNSYVTCWTA